MGRGFETRLPYVWAVDSLFLSGFLGGDAEYHTKPEKVGGDVQIAGIVSAAWNVPGAGLF